MSVFSFFSTNFLTLTSFIGSVALNTNTATTLPGGSHIQPSSLMKGIIDPYSCRLGGLTLSLTVG